MMLCVFLLLHCVDCFGWVWSMCWWWLCFVLGCVLFWVGCGLLLSWVRLLVVIVIDIVYIVVLLIVVLSFVGFIVVFWCCGWVVGLFG